MYFLGKNKIADDIEIDSHNLAIMYFIWTILTVIALILLAMYWNSRNAVWGGLTLGIIVGVLWKIFGATDWYIVVKVATIGTLLGFSAELLGIASDRLKRKNQNN